MGSNYALAVLLICSESKLCRKYLKILENLFSISCFMMFSECTEMQHWPEKITWNTMVYGEPVSSYQKRDQGDYKITVLMP